jgi:hypothetical protein
MGYLGPTTCLRSRKPEPTEPVPESLRLPGKGFTSKSTKEWTQASAGADGLPTESELIKVSATDTWDDSGAPHP